MAESRLAMALAGPLSLPDGPVAVLRPPAAYDLPLGADRARVVTGYCPDAEVWAGRGYEVTREIPDVASSIVVVPRSKVLARDMIARAAARGPVLVDGQRTDGADALWKAVRKRFGDVPSLAKAHGRAFLLPQTDALTDWLAPVPARGDHGYVTGAGVFSEDGVDPGSALLAEALPAKLPAHVVDLGAGWGYLAAAALTRDGVERLDLVEAEAAALDCARQNVTDARAVFHWADATRWRPEAPVGAVICNPPFHTTRKADPALGQAFIAAAAAMLLPSGQLWLVANRHLPYEAALRDRFVQVSEIGGDGRYKLFQANRPRRKPVS
ncbi:class I SAM-dependent methyltransferase [Roseisalinus antarcticus]|uniref:Ribosomal RNA large subunit methyltransferase G n=1 Tax=Roseisalinus antarcticus TaxID=254357 RepID=A0A1Y5RPY6_9RHOB|nr:methyltransferase [Roseisalinus antarcticus]SLN22707.1 Ribosomal RNA large subunit methyltransferase G [Roseisalinus antarcticus]